ncbi:hypothetical protein KCP69_00575 [Salmonella enterica subsp. enterica]|nr:hypothetical protein KCP69_00575 [Salmonella enterica subsp. enterica]
MRTSYRWSFYGLPRARSARLFLLLIPAHRLVVRGGYRSVLGDAPVCWAPSYLPRRQPLRAEYVAARRTFADEYQIVLSAAFAALGGLGAGSFAEPGDAAV